MRAKVLALADRQRGYVKCQQLLALGETRHSISHAIATGRLVPDYDGVYGVGRLPAHPEDRALGAVLACGEEAVLSHDSAAVVWGIFRRWIRPFHVTAPRRRERPGIHVHRAKLTSR